MAGNAIFNDFDAFTDNNTDNISPQKDIVHIRIQQRNGRKTLTTVQGLSEEYDLNLVFIYFYYFSNECNFTVFENFFYKIRSKIFKKKFSAFLVNSKLLRLTTRIKISKKNLHVIEQATEALIKK